MSKGSNLNMVEALDPLGDLQKVQKTEQHTGHMAPHMCIQQNAKTYNNTHQVLQQMEYKQKKGNEVDVID